MLYILYHSRSHLSTDEYKWQVGEPIPDIPVADIYGIDGDEAEHIDEMMGGAINRVTPRYYGDFARTIFLNLGGETVWRDDVQATVR